MKTRHFIISIIIFIVVIAGFRIIWMNQFKQTDDMQIIEGEVDFRQENINDKNVFLLDGEWTFYPNEWIIDQEKNNEQNNQFVNVPDGWNKHFTNKIHESYGYGSYRMKIYVDPSVETNYSIFIPSVRSASEIYVNGKR